MLILYAEKITPRLQYSAEIIFQTIGIKQFVFTSNLNDYKLNSEVFKINYSKKRIDNNELHIIPQGLLFEEKIQEQKTDISEWKGLKVFFPTAGELPFDIFSASFYLISRYEEYLLHKKDKYGRYSHLQSIAYKHNFLHLPLINLWLKGFAQQLTEKWPAVQLNYASFIYTPTYDIDMAWSYKGKGSRNIAGFIKEILKWKIYPAFLRCKVLLGKQKDPYDVFAWMQQLHLQHKLTPIYFFLVAEKLKKYDRNISPKNPFLKELIQKISQQNPVGIHPSWQSGDKVILLKKEIKTLRDIIQQEIVISRQHYIRFSLPDTYRSLIKENIEEDYSMGYGTINGFRASYCLPFFWFDLERNEQTTLKVLPFCYMDANAIYQQKFTAEQALIELQQLHDSVKEVNGHLITIHHNNTLAEQKEFFSWRSSYQQFLSKNFSFLPF